MSKYTIEQGNRIIAEQDGNRMIPDIDLKYHSSWAWLIPAWSMFWKEATQYSMNCEPSIWNHLHRVEISFTWQIHANNIQKAWEILVEGIEYINSKKTEKA